MYDELIAELRMHHCNAKKDDTQEICEECAYDVIIADKSVPSGFASVCVCGLMHRAADAIEQLSNAGSAYGRGWTLWYDAGREESKPRWIPVTERLPEESEGLNWHEDMMIRFTSVWCCDAKTGTIEARNRLQGKMTGNEYLDQYTKDTDWHWSKSWWEPTHWMPIVPPPQPPKEET